MLDSGSENQKLTWLCDWSTILVNMLKMKWFLLGWDIGRPDQRHGTDNQAWILREWHTENLHNSRSFQVRNNDSTSKTHTDCFLTLKIFNSTE